MKTIEVNQQKWRTLCQRVEEFCRGAMISIEVEMSNGRNERVAEGLPLRQLALDTTSDPCNTHLVIEAGRPQEKPLKHVVVEPIHIRLKNGDVPGRYNRLQILAENGTTTIQLKPGLNPELIKLLEL